MRHSFPVTKTVRKELNKHGVIRWRRIRVLKASYDYFLQSIKNGGYRRLTLEQKHALAIGCCMTHPNHRDLHKTRWVWPAIATALILLVFTVGARCQTGTSQIDVIQFQDSTGTPIKSFAAPFKIKCGVNMTCSASGSILTMAPTGGGGGGTNYQTFQNAGSNLTQRATANFFAGITCVDNAGSTRTDCNLTTVAAVSHKYFNAVTAGALVAAQPVCADLSDAGGNCTSSATIPTLPVSPANGGTGQTSHGIAGQLVVSDGTNLVPVDPAINGPDAIGAAPTKGGVAIAGTNTSTGNIIDQLIDPANGTLVKVTTMPTVTVSLPQQPLFNTTDFNDVVAGSPATGLIPYANATPKWTALAAATQGAAGGFFNEAQAVLSVPTAPALTVSNTGGTITQASGTTVFVRVTLKNAFGETTGSTETSIAVSSGNGCTVASTTCSVVVTFVTGCTTGNATGCTVYDAITSLQENQQTASNNCVNISTATCVIGTVALTSTAYPPTVNTASNGTAVIPSFVSSTGAPGAKVVMDSGATLTPCYLNGNPVAGSSCFPTLASCYGAIPQFGGTCIVAANQANGYYLETMAASLAMNKNFAGFWFTVPAIITMGSNQVTSPGGTIGPFIRAGIPWSFNNPNVGGNPTGVVFNYTGSGTAFNLGATGGSDTNFMILENIAVYISSAGSAAVGVDLQQVNFSQFPQLIIVGTSVGATTQVCLKLDGGVTFTGKNVFTNPNITGCKSDVQFNASSIDNTFIGGTYSSAVTSAIGWDFEGTTADSNIGIGIIIEGTPTAIFFSSSGANQLNDISAFLESNTTDVTWGTSAVGNRLTVLQGSSGTPGVTIGNAIVNDISGNLTNSVVDFVNFQQTNAGLFRATGFTPMVAGTGGLGTAPLPFANGFFGTAATNNSELLPDVMTGARTVGMPDASLVLPFNLRVTGDFITAANTNLQTITGLSWVMPANTVRNQAFDCYLIYNQQTAASANDAFGVQAASLAPTSINAQGSVQTAAATAHTEANLLLLNTTTATNIVAFTPSVITTTWNAELHGMIENPSGVANTINIMAKTGTSADTLTVKRGSYCLIH